MKHSRWHVYIIECEGGSLYTGVTTDPQRRLAEHRAGGCRYTRARRGIRLLRSRRCKDKVQACRYEWRLKRASRAQKLAWCEKRWAPTPPASAGSRSRRRPGPCSVARRR